MKFLTKILTKEEIDKKITPLLLYNPTNNINTLHILNPKAF